MQTAKSSSSKPQDIVTVLVIFICLTASILVSMPAIAQSQQQQPQQLSFVSEQNQVLQQPPVIVVSQNAYVESTEYLETIDEIIGGDYHIVGEVQNISPAKVEGVEVIATLYDSNNQVVGVETGYAELSTLFPNQKSPFDIIIYREDVPAQLSSYVLAVDWR